MCAKFLNDHLITRPSFAPGSNPPQPVDSATSMQISTGPLDKHEDVDKRPSDPVKEAALKRETIELARCRDDLVARYNRLHTDIAERRSRLDRLIEGLERIHRELGTTPDAPPDPGENAAALGQYRQAVEGARIELLKIEKSLTPMGPDVDTSSLLPEISSLTFGQLTRIGFGLTWPLVAAVVLGTLGVAAVLTALFAL